MTETEDHSDTNVVDWQELRWLFRRWSLESLNQLVIELIEDQDAGFY